MSARKSKVTGNRSFDDLFSLPFVVHARTPQFKRKLDVESVSSVRDAVDSMRSEIIELSALNASKQRECQQLEGDLGAVTRALNGNFGLVQHSNQMLQKENQELEQEIAEKQELLDTAKEMFMRLTSNGTDLRESHVIDYDYFYEILGQEIEAAMEEYQERIDSRAYQVIQQFPYFRDCRTNRDFLDRCRALVRAVEEKKRHRMDDESELDYQIQIEKLKRKFHDENVKIAIEMNALQERREAMLKNKSPQQSRRSSELDGSPSPIRCGSARPELEPLTQLQSCLKEPGTPRQDSGRRIVFAQNRE